MVDVGLERWGWRIGEQRGSRTGAEGVKRTATAAPPQAVRAPFAAPAVAPGRGFDLEVDELLLARARRGDRLALERLFRTFEKPAFTLARRLCGNTHDAEDVVQESLLEVFRSLGRFRGDGSFAGWVRRITVSKALMKLRRDRALAEAGAATQDEGDHPAEQDVTAARLDLRAALDSLSPTARVVVWLHEVEGYSHEEIASLLGRSVSFSKSQLARAHVRLRAFAAAGGSKAPCT